MFLGVSAGAAAVTEEAWAQPRPKLYKTAPQLPDAYEWCWQRCWSDFGPNNNYCSNLCEDAKFVNPPPTTEPIWKVGEQAYKSLKLKNGKTLWEALGY